MGGRCKREGLYVHIYLTHFIVQQKLTCHCKAIILQLKKKKRERWGTQKAERANKKETELKISSVCETGLPQWQQHFSPPPAESGVGAEPTGTSLAPHCSAPIPPCWVMFPEYPFPEVRRRRDTQSQAANPLAFFTLINHYGWWLPPWN